MALPLERGDRLTERGFEQARTVAERLGDARARPGNLWCGDDEARDVVERLNRDAGYEPVYAGGLENAGLQESFIGLVFAINRGGLGAFVYRMAPPDEL